MIRTVVGAATTAMLAIALQVVTPAPAVAAGPPETAPANDAFAAAQVITGESGSVTGTNVGATKEPGEPSHQHGSGGVGASVWYAWTAPTSGWHWFDTCSGTDFSTLVAFYTGTTVATLTEVDTSGYMCGTDNVHWAFDAVAGTTYHIAVDGFATGQFTLRWYPPPANDDFADAQTISGAAGAVAGTNVGATPGGEPLVADGAGATVWYRWIAPATGTTIFDTCTGTDFDSIVAVYTGTTEDSLIEIAANDNGNLECGLGSRLSFDATAGTTYHIVVDFHYVGGASGTFTLTWRGPPANDAFASAQAITTMAGSTTGSTVGATKEVGEPDHAGNVGGASVWFTWTAPATGTATVDTCPATDFNTLLAVYTGSSVGALTLVAENDDGEACDPGSELTFDTSAGTAYHIAVDGLHTTWGGVETTAVGAYTVSWSLAPTPPANDAFANAAVLAGPSGSMSGTNDGATKEPGEPDHAGNPGGHSVWFTWTAPTIAPTTNVWFGTCTGDDSGIDTLLSVYSGSTLAALSPVTANDDAEGCFASSQVMVTATAGTTYRIALDGAQRSGEAASGAYTLAWGPVRSDVLIRKGTRPFIGDDIYNPAGTGQTVGASVGPGGTATFTVKVQNETATRLVQRIRGAASNRNFRVTYRDPAGTDISAVVAAGMQRLFAPGETYRLTVTIKAKAGTPRGATITAATRATAVGTPVTDTAEARVTRI